MFKHRSANKSSCQEVSSQGDLGAAGHAPQILISKERERERERVSEFFLDNLLVRVHFIIVTIRWTGLAPLEFEFPLDLSRCPQRLYS